MTFEQGQAMTELDRSGWRAVNIWWGVEMRHVPIGGPVLYEKEVLPGAGEELRDVMAGVLCEAAVPPPVTSAHVWCNPDGGTTPASANSIIAEVLRAAAARIMYASENQEGMF